jgi:hypothetical protein
VTGTARPARVRGFSELTLEAWDFFERDPGRRAGVDGVADGRT